jgi:hypothetical protein
VPDWAALWRSIIIGANKSWVAFEHGTCVILLQPEEDLAAQAQRLLAEWGPVHAGSPAGDFGVIRLEKAPGWVVTCHHPDILAHVAPDEAGTPSPTDLSIGLMGRSKRDQDARTLKVVHVEDRRVP